MHSISRYAIILGLMVLSQFAAAADTKTMLYHALKDGSYEGLADPTLSKVFNVRSQSAEPLNLKITRIRKFRGECGEFKFYFSQIGIKTPNGEVVLDPVTKKPALLEYSFNVPLCLDGSTPVEAMDEERERRANLMNSCKSNLVKGVKTKDSQEAKIVFTGCPSQGNVKLFYSGTCKQIAQPPTTYVRFNFDKKGSAEVGLHIPLSCINRPAQTSKWTMHIFENINLYENQIGTVYKLWQ